MMHASPAEEERPLSHSGRRSSLVRTPRRQAASAAGLPVAGGAGSGERGQPLRAPHGGWSEDRDEPRDGRRPSPGCGDGEYRAFARPQRWEVCEIGENVVNIREAPALDAERVGQLRAGQVVDAVGRKGAWLRLARCAPRRPCSARRLRGARRALRRAARRWGAEGQPWVLFFHHQLEARLLQPLPGEPGAPAPAPALAEAGVASRAPPRESQDARPWAAPASPGGTAALALPALAKAVASPRGAPPPRGAGASQWTARAAQGVRRSTESQARPCPHITEVQPLYI